MFLPALLVFMLPAAVAEDRLVGADQDWVLIRVRHRGATRLAGRGKSAGRGKTAAHR